MKGSRWASRSAFIFIALWLCGCGARDEREINRDLEKVLETDLKAMADETRKEGGTVLDRPYFRVDSYKVTGDSYQFDRKVEVTFYYLGKVRMKQERKYRYSTISDRWERYYKQMEFDLPKPRKPGS